MVQDFKATFLKLHLCIYFVAFVCPQVHMPVTVRVQHAWISLSFPHCGPSVSKIRLSGSATGALIH